LRKQEGSKSYEGHPLHLQGQPFIFNVQLSIVNCQFFKQGQIYDDIKIDAKIEDESAKTYAA